MARKMIALLLAAALLLPAVALGEATPLPFGLKLGLNAKETEAAFDADAVLTKLSPDKSSSDGGTVDYVFENVPIPNVDVNATSLTVEIDQNNSAKATRLSSINFVISPLDQSIATFRKILAAMTQTLGAPDSDPFDEASADNYMEWGTLDAYWTRDDVRISLSLSRMFEESVTILYTSRQNYDKADLAE